MSNVFDDLKWLTWLNMPRSCPPGDFCFRWVTVEVNQNLFNCPAIGFVSINLFIMIGQLITRNASDNRLIQCFLSCEEIFFSAGVFTEVRGGS